MVRNRDIKNIEMDIGGLEKDIAFGKSEIVGLIERMDTAALNIDHLESELTEEKTDFEEAKQMITDCKKQIKEDNITLDKLRIKLTKMNGLEIEYVRPCDKSRPTNETTFKGLCLSGL